MKVMMAVAALLCVLPSQATLLGSFAGNDPANLAQFERWLGTEVDQIRAHSGRADWSDWVHSIDWLVSVWTPVDKPIGWTIPLFANGGSLEAAADGDYNAFYLQAAKSLAATRPGDEVIYVRIGEEFNGDWMPWAAAGKEQDFIDAYRQFVDTFRSVSDRFRFEWNVNVGGSLDPASAYPGDAYVDVIGMDFYYNTQWDPADPVEAWNMMVNRPYGLQWLEDFAAAHHKPTAYPEWGVNSDDAGAYIKGAAEWFDSHNVLYQAYWNSNADFPGMLSNGERPRSGATFIEVFRSAKRR